MYVCVYVCCCVYVCVCVYVCAGVSSCFEQLARTQGFFIRRNPERTNGAMEVFQLTSASAFSSLTTKLFWRFYRIYEESLRDGDAASDAGSVTGMTGSVVGGVGAGVGGSPARAARSAPSQRPSNASMHIPST